MRAIMLSPEPVITLDFVQEKLLPDLAQGQREQETHMVAGREELLIRRVLKEVGGSRSKAAEKLGMSRSTLWRKISKYQIG